MGAAERIGGANWTPHCQSRVDCGLHHTSVPIDERAYGVAGVSISTGGKFTQVEPLRARS